MIVTDSSGSQINGKVVALSDTSMTLAIQGTRRDVPEDSVRLIERTSHSIAKGALIGLAAGFGGGLLVGRLIGGWDGLSVFVLTPPVATATGAVAGGLVTHRTVLYRHPGSSDVTSSVPLMPHEQTRGHIEGAITRDAVRLGAQRANEPADRSWSNLRKLAPDTEVIVTVKGSRPVRRSVVRADEFELWVKAIDLDQVLMPIARADVVEIRQINKPGHPVRKGALIGAGAGAGIGLLWTASCRGTECWGYGAVFSALFGGIGAGVGAIIGAATHKTEEIIYFAP